MICVAAASFIEEQSFSSEKHPVAANRPNSLDGLRDAYNFGEQVKTKFKQVI